MSDHEKHKDDREIHFHVHLDGDLGGSQDKKAFPEAIVWLGKALDNMAKTLDEILASSKSTLAKVKQNRNLEASLLGVIKRYSDQIKELKAKLEEAMGDGGDDIDEEKLGDLGETLDALSTQIDEEAAEVSAAVTANTAAQDLATSPSQDTSPASLTNASPENPPPQDTKTAQQLEDDQGKRNPENATRKTSSTLP